MAKKKKKSTKKPSGNKDGFSLILERLARLMRSSEHELGLNPAQWEALRYFSRANRFSNSPIALTRYLGATKGTISQTLIALERKGYIEKNARPGERRSIMISLTKDGQELLEEDPWLRLQGYFQSEKKNQRTQVSQTLSKILEQELAFKGHPTFGSCRTCRFFREKSAKSKSSGPHFCLLMEQDLTGKETRKLCVEYEAG